MSPQNATSSRQQWVHLRDVLCVLVSRDFKLRYKRSVMGIAWSLLVPLAQLWVFYVVFHTILPLNIPNFTSFLFIGILPWNWFQTALLMSSGALVDNRDLVKQVGFPVAILPVVAVLSQAIHFLLSLPILAAFLWFDGFRPSLALISFPLVVLVQFVLTLSLSYVFATIQVKFRDIQHLLGIVLFLMFYVTPIFYDSSAIPADIQPLYRANPLVYLIDAYRAILMRGQFPASPALLVVLGSSALILMVGYAIFMRARNRFVEEL